MAGKTLTDKIENLSKQIKLLSDRIDNIKPKDRTDEILAKIDALAAMQDRRKEEKEIQDLSKILRDVKIQIDAQKALSEDIRKDVNKKLDQVLSRV